MDKFAAAFIDLARDLRVATGLTLLWKDANPSLWLQPPVMSQHQGAYCSAVKRDATRRLACIQHDALALTTWTEAEHVCVRTCPFAVTELAIGIFRAGAYQGACLLGSWQSRKIAPLLAQKKWQDLPQYKAKQAQAVARLVQQLVVNIIHLREAEPPATDKRLVLARDYIEAHLSAELRADTVAREVGLSRSRFVHWFAEAGGVAYRTWLRNRLMQRAALMLCDSNRSVTATAGALGYSALPAFTAAFRAVHGAAPAHWRKRLAHVEA